MTLEEVAYNYDLKPSEFYAMNLSQFNRYIEARSKKERRNYIIDNVRFGRLIAVMVNMFSEKGNAKESDFFETELEEKRQKSVEEISTKLLGYFARIGSTFET